MNIILINPPRYNSIPVIREDRCEITDRYSVVPPYSLIQMASLLRDNHTVTIIDANLDDLLLHELSTKIENIDPEAVIFRFSPTTFENDMKIAGIVKSINNDITVIGLCWTLRTFAEEILSHNIEIDVYVVDDYEIVIPKLVDAISTNIDLRNISGIVFRSNNEVLKTQPETEEVDYDCLPIPSYDLLPSLNDYYINTKHGSPFTIMYTSKGCPYKCIYCTVRNTVWKGKSADIILREIRYLLENYHIKTISFFDETFTFDRQRVVDLCNKMVNERLKITWYCNTRVNKVDEELLRLMKQAGCKGMSFGIESGSQTILNNAKKGTTVKQAEDAIRMAKKAGIKTYISCMFGLPGETWETVHETIDFVKRTLPNGAQFNVTVPYPGTELNEMAINQGFIPRDLDWTQLYQHKSLLRTDDMSTDDLEQARKMAYRSLYFNPGWILSNMLFLLRQPGDIPLAVRYYMKSLTNFLVHKMEHAH
jgi:anaerobic magnesium-protoporphyrin IX monomethyl ester cyclase